MHILHINQRGTAIGGAELYIRDVSAALTDAGHQTSLAVLDSDGPYDLIDRTYSLAAPEISGSVRSLIDKLDELSVLIKPDVVFIHTVYLPEVIKWAADRLPTVAYAHAPYIACPGFARYLRRKQTVCRKKVGNICMVSAQVQKCCYGRNPLGHYAALKRTRRLLSVYRRIPIFVGSDYMRRILEQNNIPLEKIFRLSPVLFKETAVPYKPPNDYSTVLFVGRVIPEKGLHHLIEALSLLGDPWKLIVVGDGEGLESIKRRLSAAGLTARVDFRGWVDHKSVEQIYPEASFVILPSLWPEPFARVGPEAFRAGRPVIAYDVGGISSWLEDEVTGYLVEQGNVAQLRQRILGLLNSPEIQRQMGQTAHTVASKQWSTEQHITDLIAYFDRTIDQSPRSRKQRLISGP